VAELSPFTIPPATAVAGQAGFITDIDNAYAAIARAIGVNVQNSAYAGGARGDNVTDDTAAIQAAINAQAGPVYFPPGLYRVSQLTLLDGTVLVGAGCGSYPDNNSVPGISVLVRIASTNLDLLLIPDGNNYGRIYDLAIDGNKNNNTSGYGCKIADGASGQESQWIIERVYFHDNPQSNLYLGNNRRANKVLKSVFNYSGSGDGITTCGSDNLIRNNIIGTNGRAGICLGTGATQNWSATIPTNPAAVEHILDNDIYGCVVGIALAASTSDCMVMGNGIDRNTKQGITVYDGTSNVIDCNSIHSNGTLTNNTYAHIDVGSGVTSVGIANNNFGPLDGGVTNVASFCVNYGGSTGGIIAGNIGIADATASVGGLINSSSNTPSYVMLSKAGATIQGSGNDVLDIRNSSGTLLTKITQGGSFVHTGGGAQFSAYIEPGNGSTAGGHLWSGSGAPNIAASVAGDFYFRTDTPGTSGQRIYIATAANTWTALSI
jgi:Pectate lyase superfamily protein